ncbi:hypothetical protein [Streptosporangium sp. NPDC049078]|uniref:hypothetical protein n=1 Tax=Streptosporangium sp. NPDC049078 TaxID=3155767 RepID=UPI00342A5631
MSRNLTVYRTTNPDILATLHTTLAAIEEWQPKVEALMETLGVGGRKIWYDAVTGQVLGVSRDGDIPEHWRYDQRTGYLMPRRSTKQGKAIGARLDAMRRPDPRALKGMPSQTFAAAEPALLTCRVDEMGGALYVTWSAPIHEREVDLSLWQRVKLSEYYAVLEAQEAAQAAQESAGEAPGA